MVLLAVLTVISAMFSIVALSHGLWFYSAYAGVITCFGITALRLALAYLIR